MDMIMKSYSKRCNMQRKQNTSACSCYYEKGKGYKPAESDVIGTWHGTGPYKIESGDFVKPKEVAPAWSAVVSETVLKLARTDERIVAITPAMPVDRNLRNSKRIPRSYD